MRFLLLFFFNKHCQFAFGKAFAVCSVLEWARIPWAGPADPSPVSLRLLFLTDAPQACWLLPPSLQPPSIPVPCHRAVSSLSFCAGSPKSSFLHWKSPSHLLGERFLKCPMENIPHPWSSHSLIPSRVSLHRTYHCTNSNIYYLFLLTIYFPTCIQFWGRWVLFATQE